MAINKVIYDTDTLIDLTEDTVTPETLSVGVTAHDAAGNAITGTAATYVIDNVLYIPFGTVSGNVLEV